MMPEPKILTTCLRIFPYCENSCSINDVAAGGKLQHPVHIRFISMKKPRYLIIASISINNKAQAKCRNN